MSDKPDGVKHEETIADLDLPEAQATDVKGGDTPELEEVGFVYQKIDLAKKPGLKDRQ